MKDPELAVEWYVDEEGLKKRTKKLWAGRTSVEREQLPGMLH